jgi:hypothetical protein
MRFILRKILLAVLLTIIMCPSIKASGLWLYEQGTPDLGTAGAGRAAMVQGRINSFRQSCRHDALEGFTAHRRCPSAFSTDQI